MSKFHGTPLDDLFGDRTWADVQTALSRKARWNWAQKLQHADIEDAVSAALVDLIDYWSGLESSRGGDDDRRWAYALTRGGHTANRQCSARYQEFLNTFSVMHDDMVANEREEDFRLVHAFRPSVPGAEEVIINRNEVRRQQLLVDTIPDHEWHSWLTDYVQGRSVRAAGELQGVSHVAIVRRRQRGLARLRKHFSEEQA